jgi:hypothetical protein
VRNILIEDAHLFNPDLDHPGMEFDGEQWKPKHPLVIDESLHDRRVCEFINGEWVEKLISAISDGVAVNLLWRRSAIETGQPLRGRSDSWVYSSF